ncbi:hypothetical protein R52603_00517 [Paraburkholderia saeva]|nr:hypothetical protein R52603_00517 [Paraburkholderia saeva]
MNHPTPADIACVWMLTTAVCLVSGFIFFVLAFAIFLK